MKEQQLKEMKTEKYLNKGGVNKLW